MARRAGPYKIRVIARHRGTERPVYGITIPAEIAEAVPDAARFAVGFADDGILLRLADPTERAVAPPPRWAGRVQELRAAPKDDPPGTEVPDREPPRDPPAEPSPLAGRGGPA